MSQSDSPYSGTDTGLYAYPYLTSFRDSSLTDNWLLLRDGDIGVRWITCNDWELGLVGRVQTVGTGSSESDDLIGIDSRKWTIEIGPTICWRRLPVHVSLTAHEEIVGRHGGNVSELALTLPWEWRHGYVVPVIAAVWQSDEYTNYYYNVSAVEAAGLRAPYEAGNSLNTQLRVHWGFDLNDRWLLSGSAGIEILDSEISDSPIVDQDSLFSANIGLAYNADVFQSRDFELSTRSEGAFELSLGAFFSNIDTKLMHRAGDGTPGTKIDLEDALNAPDNETVLRVEALWRIGNYHRLEASYYDFSRSGTRILENPLRLSDTQFAAGTAVGSQSDTKVYRLTYGYSLIRDSQKELGVMAGLHLSRIDLSIDVEDGGRRGSSNADTPLPVAECRTSKGDSISPRILSSSVPRRLRPEQSLAGAGHPGGARQARRH